MLYSIRRASMICCASAKLRNQRSLRAVVVTFAVGIGANATMFGVLDQLLLRPPPHIVGAEELYQPETTFRLRSGEIVGSSASYPQYVDIRDHVAGFTGVAMATGPRQVSLGVGPEATPIMQQLVSGNYFDRRSRRARPRHTTCDAIRATQPAQRTYQDDAHYGGLGASALRTGALTFAIFGVIAIALAALGLYSVLAYAMAQRRQGSGCALRSAPRDAT